MTDTTAPPIADAVTAAIAALPMPALGLDADLRVRAANAAARRLAPTTGDADGVPVEPRGRLLTELLPPSAVETVRSGILRAHALKRRQRVRPFAGMDARSAPLGLAAFDINVVEDPASRIRTLILGDDADEDSGEEASAYRRLIESTRDLIWSVDSEGRWTFLNGACRAIYGVEPEQLLGRPFSEVVLPSQLPVDMRLFAKLIAGERIVDHHTRHVRGDGAVIDMLFTAEPLRAPDGRVVGIVGSAQDITLRRRAERLVHESEWRFRKLVDVAPFGILVTRDGLIAFANAAACAMAARDDLVGRSVVDLIAADDRPGYAEAAQSVQRDGRDALPIEVRIERVGAIAHVEMLCVPYTHEGDGAQLVVWRDTSAHKAAEGALQQERAFNEHIVRAMPVYAVGIAADGRTVFANPAVCRATGYAEQELIGADWWRLFYPGDEYRQVEQLMRDMTDIGNVRDYPMTLTTRDSAKRTVAWTSINRFAADGSLDVVVGIGLDLTERRVLEAQLNQSQKLESIGQLAAGIAHEINTPTQFVGDNLRFLKDAFGDLAPLLAAPSAACGLREGDADYLREEIPKAIDQSIEGVSRVASIVRAMKDFSHPDQGERTPVDLNQAVRTTLTVARNEYKYVADLETDLAADLPPVACLVGEINQVVLNLVVNAAHAIAEVSAAGGRGRISVLTRRDGDEVEIRVADTGGGIPEHARPRIFEPFFTTKPVGKGTGQGLFIAHTVVVKKHGGSIRFETESGRGTVFVIRLPIEAPPAAGGG